MQKALKKGSQEKSDSFLGSLLLANYHFHPLFFRDRGNGVDVSVRINGDFLAHFLSCLFERDDQGATDGAEDRQNQDHAEQLPFKF